MGLPDHTVASTLADLGIVGASGHPPRVLVLYGSLRERSFSRLLAEEAGRVLTHMGADVRFFDPHGLPMFDRESDDHPAVQQLRELSVWSEAHVWSCPEQHGAMTGVFKNQLDWLPLKTGAVRPTS